MVFFILRSLAICPEQNMYGVFFMCSFFVFDFRIKKAESLKT